WRPRLDPELRERFDGRIWTRLAHDVVDRPSPPHRDAGDQVVRQVERHDGQAEQRPATLGEPAIQRAIVDEHPSERAYRDGYRGRPPPNECRERGDDTKPSQKSVGTLANAEVQHARALLLDRDQLSLLHEKPRPRNAPVFEVGSNHRAQRPNFEVLDLDLRAEDDSMAQRSNA